MKFGMFLKLGSLVNLLLLYSILEVYQICFALSPVSFRPNWECICLSKILKNFIVSFVFSVIHATKNWEKIFPQHVFWKLLSLPSFYLDWW